VESRKGKTAGKTVESSKWKVEREKQPAACSGQFSVKD